MPCFYILQIVFDTAYEICDREDAEMWQENVRAAINRCVKPDTSERL
jgi:hypothetical protein